MTNIGHTTFRAKNVRNLAISILAILFALSLSLLDVQKQAHAQITFPQIYTVNQTSDQSDADLNDSHCDVDTNLSGYQCTLRAAIEQTNAIPGADAINFGIPGTGVHTIKPATQLPTITDTVTIDGYSEPGSSANTLAKGTNAQVMVELDGENAGNGTVGLKVSAPDTVVRGLAINRFRAIGIYVWFGSDVRIEGNFIGTDPSGTTAPLAFQHGQGAVAIQNTSGTNVVGGATPEARNLISGNDGRGVYFDSEGIEVSGNLIGTSIDGKSPLGNSGAGIEVASSDNIVGRAAPGYANTIAFNGGDGVVISGSNRVGNNILSNSIFSNGEQGIELGYNDGVTPNDAGDADTGANNLQNYPVLSSAKKGAGKTTIKGKLNSTPNQTFELQFFKNPEGTDEGKALLFSKSLTADGAGNVSFTFATTKKVGLGQNITATATKDSTGDTSEFSAPREVVAS